MDFFAFNTFFVYFQKIDEDKIKNTEKRKGERTGCNGVELFKEGKYKEAISQFTTYLNMMPDNENKKVAHYNRGMAYNKLGQHDNALEDGEECLKIDPYWAKGYKCKGLALEGMGRPRDAEGTFLDGKKMCVGIDQNAEAVLNEPIKRLNKVTGFLGHDLDLLYRMKKEKYCVTCKLFEKDIVGSLQLDDSKKFTSCDKCKMVNYCSMQHREDDRVTHDEVCEELLMIRKTSEKDFGIEILPKEDALILLALNPRGTKGHEIANMMERSHFPPIVKNIMDYLRGVGHGNLVPLYQLARFKPIPKAQQKELNTWNDLFTMLDKRRAGPELTTELEKIIRYEDIKRTLTYALTDPMTVFYAMKKVNLWNNGDKNKVIRLHVLGAETRVENHKVLFNVLSNITGRKLHIVYIGPLMIFSPGQKPKANPEFTVFQGIYQDYVLTSDYQKPDCIVAFFPGLYDGTYNWLPAVAHAIATKVPFLVTCSYKEDYQKTKEWLMKRTGMKPEIVQDYLNPFCSWEAWQEVPGSNSVKKRNMFSLVLLGGDFGGDLQRLLQVEDEKFELLQVSLRSLGIISLSDIMKLKKSGKM